MPTTTASQINELLQSTSPFSRPLILKQEDIWGGNNFPDLEFLNAHASDAVIKALDAVKREEYDTTSMLIIADNGSGKSHLISRLRRKIKLQKSGFFLVVGLIDNLNLPQQSFQSFLASSLAHEGSLGITQWQELAADIFNSVWRITKLGHTDPVRLVDVFNNQIKRENKTESFILSTTSRYCSLNPDVSDSDVIRAILWTLVKGESSLSAIKWLAGNELSDYNANKLKLPRGNQCFGTILEILKVISFHKELVICFDELDNLDVDENGFPRASIVAGLIKDLFQNLHRGVIVSFMDTITWRERVKKRTAQATWQRVSTYGDPIILRSLSEDLCLSLLKLYLERFYSNYNIIPPDPIYPFTESEVRAKGSQRPTTRKFLEWCREYIIKFNQQSEEIIVDITSRTQEVFEGELESVNDQILDDESLISTVLFSEFKALIGHTIEGVTIESVEEKVISQGKGKKDKYINFKIIGTDEGKPTVIAVCVAQTDNGKTLAAALKRLVKPEDYKIKMTRGCLVRSSSKQITGYNKNTYLIPLTEQLGGEFVGLKFEEIKPLIALHRVYQKRETDYELTEAEIQDFIKEKGREFLLREHNPLIQEILSDPSGQAPDLEMEPEVPVDTPVNNELTNGDGEDIENFFSA